MKAYAVFRNSSNSVNQPMAQRLLVWSGEAKDEEDAKLRARRGGVKCLNNQYLDAILVEELEGEDQAVYSESQDTVLLQSFSLPAKLHSRMKKAAANEGKSLKNWRIEAYEEKLRKA
jgi:hypothetical protein